MQSSTLNTFQYSNQMDISIFNTYFYISRTCFVCYIRHLQGETLITCTNPSAFYCVLYMLHWLYYRLQHICFCRFTMFLQWLKQCFYLLVLTLWRLTTYIYVAHLTSRRWILNIYPTNILTEYFKHAAHSPFFFSLQDAVYFITLSFLVPVIVTF